MASSGTKTFTLQIDEIIEEAYERIGLESQTGYDYKTARRSLNLLMTEWMNAGVNLWSLSLATLALTTGTKSYTLPTTVIDVLDAARRDNTSTDVIDTPMWHISMQEYISSRPNKTNTGPVTHYAVERNPSGGHELYTWPVTDDASDTILYWAMSYADDVSTTGGDQTADVPKRFIPALVAGLSWRLAPKKLDMKSPESMALVGLLKADYDQTFQLAKDEDRERSSFFVVPGVGYI